MTERLVNDAMSFLNGAIDDSQTTLDVLDAAGSGFLSAGNYRLRIDDEWMLVTSISSNTLTVTRGIESSTPVAHADGAEVWVVHTKGALETYVGERAKLAQFAGGAVPTVNEDSADGYEVGSVWVYGTEIYTCTDSTGGAAVWTRQGTVTSVGLTQPAAGITVTGSPVTGAGSMTLALADDLAALEGMSGTGLVTRTASNTYAQRTLTGGGDIFVSNGNGVSGNPSIVTVGNLSSLENQNGPGFIYANSSGSFLSDARVMTGTANSITVTNGNGVSGNPTFAVSATYPGQSSIVTVGALTSGSTGAGFTIALATATVTGTLGAANGGTGIASYAVGDILYASASTTLAKLSMATDGKVLTDRGAATAPAMTWHWQQNRLYNTSAAIWQRQPGTESTDTSYSDDTYSADGYNVLTQTAAVQASRQTGDTRSRYCYRLKQNQASAQRMGFCMILEAQDCIDLRGEVVRFQGRVKISNSQVVRYAIIEWTGTADSPVSDPVNDWTSGTFTTGNFFKSTTTTVTATAGPTAPSAATWTAFSLTGTVSSSCTNLMVMVWTEGTAAQNVTLDVAEMGLYLGAEGKLWVPPPIGEELRRCQRYFWRFLGATSNIIYGWRQSTNVIRGSLVLPVDMRAAATLGGSSPSWSASDPSTNNQIAFFNPTAGYRTISGALSNISNVGTKFVEFIYTAGTSFGGSSGEVGFIQLGTAAYIDFSAEL